MVKLIDEISQIQYLNDERVIFLTKLCKESQQYEQRDHERPQCDPRSGYATQTTTEMIDQALHKIEEDNNRFPQYLRDLRSNLDVVRIAGDQSVLSSALQGQLLKLYQ